MGGGDLNMKKSWHPLLLKNQERVWLEEKKALEEKKKLDQLRKEKDEERQLQDLQRLQEEQTGKKRQEKLEWMYSTPATGTSQNANDLEDYLLGKKRVDKILTAGENEKIGAAHKNFIATQFANTVRDTAAKIREDPLLAIKQQEQAAYQALLSNPLRLREMQERNGIKQKKDKKDKKHKKDKHRERSTSPDRKQKRSDSRDRYSHSRRSRSPHDRRSRSPIPRRSSYDNDVGYGRSHEPLPHRRERSRSPDDRRRGRSPDVDKRLPKEERERIRAWPRSDESDDNNYDGRRRSRSREQKYSRKSPRYEPYPARRTQHSPSQSRLSQESKPAAAAEERAARLAAMTSNASAMSDERRQHLTTLLAQEKAELELEEKARMKSRGMGGFLSQEQKKVFGGAGGIEERIRRGRGQMRVDAD